MLCFEVSSDLYDSSVCVFEGLCNLFDIVLTDLWFYINRSKFSLHFTNLYKTESAAELNWSVSETFSLP